MIPEANEGMNETFNERYTNLTNGNSVTFFVAELPFSYSDSNSKSKANRAYRMHEFWHFVIQDLERTISGGSSTLLKKTFLLTTSTSFDI